MSSSARFPVADPVRQDGNAGIGADVPAARSCTRPQSREVEWNRNAFSGGDTAIPCAAEVL
jgi:hypothetical protein